MSRTGGDAARVGPIRATAHTVPTDLPEADGTLAWDSTTLVLVEIRSSRVSGIGWTYRPAACAQLVGELLAPAVIGSDPMGVTATFEAMVRSVRNACRPGAVGYAISAVDIALWDLKARLLGLPLHHLLGAVRDSVPVYGSGGFTTYDPGQQREQLRDWVARQHIPRVKIKIGESWGTQLARDLSRLTAARSTIGPDTELYADANGAYTTTQATWLMRAATGLDVRWLEEPVSSDDLAGLRQVRAGVGAGVEIAAGEYGHDLSYFHRMCATGAVDCLQADVTRCGGITEWLRVAAVAAAHHLQLSGHCAPHLHAHAAATIPNLRHLEWFHDHVRIETMLFESTLDPTGGVLRPDPARPGHGLTTRPDTVRRYQVGQPVTVELTAAARARS